MNNKPIGILDSGVGGLTIWQEIAAQLPEESTVYIADSKNCPYGSRSKDEIHTLASRLVQFLVNKQCKLIVIACNTITVNCIDRLRVEFPHIPLIGTVPVIKMAVERSQSRRIGVLSTTSTAESQYQKDLIAKFGFNATIINRGTDQLVPLVEQGIMSGVTVDQILKAELKPFQEADIDVLALGCSHYPFLRDSMQQILGSNIEILDSAGAIARQVKRVLEKNGSLNSQSNPTYDFYTTGDKQKFEHILSSLTRKKGENVIQTYSIEL